MDFAKNNPGTVVYLKPRRHRSPCMVAEYCEYFFLTERMWFNGFKTNIL